MPYGKFKMGKDKPKKPGDRKTIMPVKPGNPSKPGKVRPDLGYGPGRKPAPGNGGGPVRPRPLPLPKPKKRGL